MSQYHTDHATREDLLNYENFRDALEDIVTKAETPLTVGIFGPWGSGKTSLMQMVRDQIEQAGKARYRTIWFTAWKYDRQEALWRAFILRVIDALYPRENTPADLPREARELLQNPGEREQRLIALLQRLEESVYQAVEWQEMGDRSVQWWQFISNVAKAGVETSAAVGTAGLSLQIKKMLGGDDTPVEEIQKAAAAIGHETKQYHRRQLFHMEDFERVFKEAVQLIDKSGNGRLIVFVDDLDRCLPEKAIEILEAIKLFLEVPGVVFVLGMDQAVVRQGIEARYGSYFQQQPDERAELPIRGDVYLQKIVQIPFHLPALAVDDVADFIADLDGSLSPHTQAVLAQGLYPNPRQVKRVLNILRLLRRIADSRFDEGTIDTPLLAKTVIIQTQYPELYQLWRQYPTLVQLLETEYGRRTASDEEILTGTRRQPRPTPEIGEAEVEKTDERETSQPGLLTQYLENPSQYALLIRLMTYEPEGETTERIRFTGLSRDQVAAYVRLAGAVESDAPVPVDLPTPLVEAMLSGDALQIQDAASRLQSEEPERDGAKHQEMRRQMIQVLSSPNQPIATRLSAGEALAHLGDSRFHEAAGHYLPADEMLGFVEIPAGNFRMGSEPQPGQDAGEDEQPQHTLALDTFYMAKYPVTVAQFGHFVAQSGYEGGGREGVANHPVRYLTWYDAIAYCDWLNKALRSWSGTPNLLAERLNNGWRVTLPSEAEWEKAARGTDGRLYPWGNEFVEDNANYEAHRLDNPSPVGCFPTGASPHGLLDMSGNVYEWTRSLYRPYEYKSDDGREKVVGTDRDRFVLRGGGYGSKPEYLRCACRIRNSVRTATSTTTSGMRVCVSPFTP